MQNIIFLETKNIDKEAIHALYASVDWNLYLEPEDKLIKAFEKSLDVISAWDESELIGVIRTIGDGITIIYLQDILVKKSYQNQGVGKKLLEKILQKYDTIRQIVLLTDNDEGVKSFYNKNGLKNASELQMNTFVKFN